MKALVLLTWAVLASEPELKDVYTWVDEEGITHYTNTPDEIPARHRRTKKPAKGGELGEVRTAGARASGESGDGAARTSTSRSNSRSSGVIRSEPNEQHWRSRFRAARAQIGLLKGQIRRTKEEIARLSVGRVMDSGGFLVTHPELQPARDRLHELEGELDRSEHSLRRLHMEAGDQGVPQSWR